MSFLCKLLILLLKFQHVPRSELVSESIFKKNQILKQVQDENCEVYELIRLVMSG